MYINLINHNSATTDSLIDIEKCFYVAYLEDEFSREFYDLLKEPNDFENMVVNYLMNSEIKLCITCNASNECGESSGTKNCRYAECKNFIDEIKYGFEHELIDSAYSMYFFKFPKGKHIKNVYDQGIHNALLRNSIQPVQNFNEYANNCNEKEIITTVKQLIKVNHMPTIIFNNKRLFEITYDNFIDELKVKLLSYDIIKDSKKSLQILEDIKNFGGEKSTHCLDIYINDSASKLKNELEDDALIDIRKKLLSISKEFPLIYQVLYDESFPAVSKDEMKEINNINSLFKILNPSQINDEIIDNISQLDMNKVNAKDYLSFLERNADIDTELFKRIIFTFDPKLFGMKRNEKFRVSSNEKYIENLSLNNPTEILKFCKFYMFIPSNLEKKFIDNLYTISEEDQKNIVKEYVNLIISLNCISTNGLNFLDKYSIKYGYTTSIEEEMFFKKKYRLYVYSKAARTSLFDLDQKEKMVKLEEEYKCYFLNSTNLGKNVKPTVEMLKYLTTKININDIPVEKRNLFCIFPQTYNEIEYILKNKDNDYINTYLKGIISFDNKCGQKIFDLIYSWAFLGERMKNDTYQSLKRIIAKKNSSKFSVLKRKKKLIN